MSIACIVILGLAAGAGAIDTAAAEKVFRAELEPADSAIEVPKLSTTEQEQPGHTAADIKPLVPEDDDFLEHGSVEHKLPMTPGNATVHDHPAGLPLDAAAEPERFEDAAAGLQKGLQDLLKDHNTPPPKAGAGGVSSLTTASTAEGADLQAQLEQVLQSAGNASGIVHIQRVEPPPSNTAGGAEKQAAPPPHAAAASPKPAAGKPKTVAQPLAPSAVLGEKNVTAAGAPAGAPVSAKQPPISNTPKGAEQGDVTEPEHDSGTSVVFLKGQLGESCSAACSRAGHGKLACLAAQLPVANSCIMLDKAFGCGGESKCLAVAGIDKPAAVLLPGAQAPLCFLHQGFASAPPGQAECDAAQHMSARLCPCGLISGTAGTVEAGALLSAAQAADPQALQAEREKVLAMARAVDVLIRQYNGTAASLAATQARLERLQAIDRAEEEIADIMRAVHSHKIDYETGKVTMPDGSKLSYGAAMGRLKELQALTKIKSEQAKADVPQAEQGKDPRAEQGDKQPPPPVEGGAGGAILPEAGDEIAAIDPAILSYDMELLQDMGILLCVGALGGVLFSFTGLPPSFGFLLMGMAAGPNGWDAIRDTAGVSSVAQFGVVFPLFLNGMQFGLKFKNAAALSSLAAQSTVITAVVFTGLAMAAFAILGITTGPGEGVIMGMALSLASPAVSIANLIDHGRLGSTGGQVTLAMLAVQDLIMGFMLSLPHALGVLAGPGGGHGGDGTLTHPEGEGGFLASYSREMQAAMLLMRSAVSLMGMVLLIYLWSRGVFRRLLARCGWRSAATCPGVTPEHHKRDEELSAEQRRTSEEVFLLGLVGACMIGALSTEALGLSLEMGAFLAGLLLSSSAVAPVSKLVAAVMPLSRLFSAMFLASVGLVLSPVFLWNNLGMLLLALGLLMSVKAAVLYVVLRSFRLSSEAAVVATVAMTSMAEVGLAFTGKAHAMGLISRYCYLLLLSTVVLSTLASPLVHRAQRHIVRVLQYLDCGGGEGGGEGGALSPVNYAAVPAGVNVAEEDFRSKGGTPATGDRDVDDEPVFQAAAVHAAARTPQRSTDESRMRGVLGETQASPLRRSDHSGEV